VPPLIIAEKFADVREPVQDAAPDIPPFQRMIGVLAPTFQARVRAPHHPRGLGFGQPRAARQLVDVEVRMRRDAAGPLAWLLCFNLSLKVLTCGAACACTRDVEI
jgi:hypothetical protein